MTSYVFPGQGSQKVGMGSELFEKFPEYIKQANDILGYNAAQLCLENPDNKLGNTAYTQPLLYLVSTLEYLNTKDEENIKPTFFAGHSLGEYAALFAANVFDFKTGLQLVQKRGELMSQASGGGMAAVIGMSGENIQDLITTQHLTAIQVANFNEPNQTVISGEKEAILAAKQQFEEAGARRYIPLPVSGAFHSKFMEDAKDKFATYIENFTFSEPTIPVIANVTAKPYVQENIKTLLIDQIVSSVQWVKSIQYIINQNETDFKEIGPGSVLTGLIAKIKRHS
ncbi:[acyl-carrier-protein] S-malonyltransferase [Candidatus Marinamargulisbacteria bacterium SCGC AG-414-C22]|nr:[acyl-carrier-protein] S-malonyltransferase [Candidatus Marinamargulisbacteria bacterium SCGC AG-414-C22]